MRWYIIFISLVVGFIVGVPRSCGLWDGINPSFPGEGLNIGGPIICFGVLPFPLYRAFTPLESLLYSFLSVISYTAIVAILIFILQKIYFRMKKRYFS